MSEHDEDDGIKEPYVPMAAHVQDEEEHEGAPEWLISFADMVMLIMGFFVILYALNATPPVQAGAQGDSDGETATSMPFERWAEFVWNTRQAFGNPIDEETTDPELRKILDWYYADGPGSADDDGEVGEKRDVRSPHDNGERSTILDVQFANDGDVLSDSAHEALARLAERIRGLPTIVEIRGYASEGEAGRGGMKALDLSYTRSRAVAEALVAAGVPWRRLEIVAASNNAPLSKHPADAEADAPNRRVEVQVTDRIAREPVRTAPVD